MLVWEAYADFRTKLFQLDQWSFIHCFHPNKCLYLINAECAVLSKRAGT